MEDAIKLMEVGYEFTLRLKDISYSERGNEIMDYSKNKGVITNAAFVNIRNMGMRKCLFMQAFVQATWRNPLIFTPDF